MNMLSRIKTSIYYRWHNFIAAKRDKHINRHIIVFESDDWGAIRVPSRKAYDALMEEGYAMDKRPYEHYDCLESDEDIKALSDLLLKYKDSSGNHPIITLNYLSANPDFQKIEENRFSKYVYETIEETYRKHPESNHVIELVKKGIEDKVFMPQCHGREHFNAQQWMTALQSGDKDVITAFKYGMCGIFPMDNPSAGNQYMVALRYQDQSSKQYVCQSVSDSFDMFEKTWGFKSETFIAPCYTWSDDIEQVLSEKGVRLLQSSRIQRFADHAGMVFRSIGEKNKYQQVYSIRNCSFEPSLEHRKDELEECLREIKLAFLQGKPAVLSIHRINFVSGIDADNRNNTLELLDRFISTILSEYPDVEFLSTPQLIKIFQ